MPPSPHVLLVEDDESKAYVMQELLNFNGFKAEVALNGTEALQKFKTGAYRILVTDFKLPDFNGVELARRCREIDPKVRVVYLTGFDAQLPRKEIEHDPQTIVIPKETKPSKILEGIRHVLAE